MTATSVERFGERLGLSRDQINWYALQVKGAGEVSELAAQLTPEFKELNQDSFQLIADWFHFAILELTTVRGFQPNSRWVARKLGLSQIAAQEAIDRLIRLGFVTVRRNGSWKLSEGHTTTLGIDIQAQALRGLQKQALEMGIRALDEIPSELRDQTTMTIAVDFDRLDDAKKMIRSFRRKLATYLETGPKRDEVYHLSIALYPLTKISSGTEERK